MGRLDKMHGQKLRKLVFLFNAVFITVCLLFGDYFGLWDISSSQKRHVFYIGSLEGKENYVKDFPGIKDAIAENGEIEIPKVLQKYNYI